MQMTRLLISICKGPDVHREAVITSSDTLVGPPQLPCALGCHLRRLHEAHASLGTQRGRILNNSCSDTKTGEAEIGGSPNGSSPDLAIGARPKWGQLLTGVQFPLVRKVRQRIAGRAG